MRHLDILVVDDDVDFAEAIADVLDLAGHSVDMAHSGEEAVRRRRERHYDLVFLDLALPGIDGLDALAQIHGVGYAPAVIMTAHVDAERLAQVPSSGAVALLHKPCSVEAILEIVRRRAELGSVLVVDDDTDFLDSMREALERQRYAVFTEANGQAALARLRECGASTLVLDLRMPRCHGMDVYRNLLESEVPVAVVVVTAYRSEERELLSSLKDAQEVTVLHKPFAPDRLFAALARATERRLAS